MSHPVRNQNEQANCQANTDISLLDTQYDVIVIGAGPAGSSAANTIARNGANVLLIDKAAFPRHKVCGCCLSFKSLRIMETLGLSQLLNASGGVVLSTLRIAVNGRGAAVELPGGLSVSRSYLDCAMIAAAREQGASFLAGTKAKIGAVNSAYREVILEQSGSRRTLKATVVISAGGISGSSRDITPEDSTACGSKIGLGAILPPQPALIESGTIYMACAQAGYVGLVGIENNLVDVAAAIDPIFIRDSGGPAQAASAIMLSAGMAEIADLQQAQWQGTIPLTHTLPSPAATRLFVIGDAAGYTEPFTGEGIAWAMSSGAMVAPFALDAINEWGDHLAIDWSKLYRASIYKQQTASRYISSILRNPTLSEWAVTAIANFPGLVKPLVNYINAV